MKPVKIHGQLRCGTNYLTRVLRENFPVVAYESDEGGWKHGPMAGDAGVAYVLVAKDPYSWILSFKRWEEIHNRTRVTDLAGFLRAPVSHPRLRSTWDASNPVDAWNRSYRSWLACRDRHGVTVVNYERLLTAFDRTLTDVGSGIGVPPAQQPFVNVADRVDTWATPRKRPPLDLDAYISGVAPAAFDDDALGLVRKHIDTDVVGELGYSVL